MENHPAIVLFKYVYLIIQYVTSLKYGRLFNPCVVLAKHGSTQETFPILRK